MERSALIEDREKLPRKRTCVFLDRKQIEGLKLLSGTTRVKEADYVREGIDQVLEKYQGRLLIGKE